MKYVVNLAYVTFRTKHVSTFSETINAFTTDIDDEGNEKESDTESYQEDTDIFDDKSMENDVIGSCSIKTFWDGN